jgi:hypothetical protein
VVEDFAVPTDPALLANGILDFMVDDHETSWRFAECLGAVNGYFRIVGHVQATLSQELESMGISSVAFLQLEALVPVSDA